MERELVLFVGMHRSGTSLTASLLQAIGLPLPGQLIGADVANPSGYFENRAIVDAQENLLHELGYWWPTEAASRGMPKRLRRSTAYHAYKEWLISYLRQIYASGEPRLAIKDPRTSLLLPAWRTATARLGIRLRLVICLRQPRDVCWSLVWRDGPSVGLGWQRSQRLWLEHYRALLIDGKGVPAEVALYEHWLDPNLAAVQLNRVAGFLGLTPTPEQRDIALQRVKPEFNHGGGEQLPSVAWSLRLMYAALRRSAYARQDWIRSDATARWCSFILKTEQHAISIRSRLRLLRLITREGRDQLAPAFDAELLRQQLGSKSLWRFLCRFGREEDLRPHPLISPAYLNQERQRCGLPPLRNAGDLFLHLLNPDLIPLNPHPWFDCRTYQQRSRLLGAAGEHPVLTYLRRNLQCAHNPYLAPGLLLQLGAGRPLHTLKALPGFIQCLRPGLVLADALQSLGDPSEGDPAVVIAHEAHWKALEDTFSSWPADDPDAPLNWFTAQGGLAPIATKSSKPADSTSCWWLPGEWTAPVLAELCGADLELDHQFESTEALIKALADWQPGDPPPLIALTPALLAAVLMHRTPFPPGTVVLNLSWPKPEQQSAWLHLLAGTSAVLECRPAVRGYLHSLELPVIWPTAPGSEQVPDSSPGHHHLLLSLTASHAETQLARCAGDLDPQRYSAFLRLDAQLLSLGNDAKAPGAWLERMRSQHDRWIWLTGPTAPGDIRAWAIQAWAEQQGAPLQILDQNDQNWMKPFSRARNQA